MGDSVGNNFLVDGDVIAHNLVTFYDWHAYGPPVCSFTCFGTQVIWFAQVNRIVIDTLRMQYQNPTSYWKSWKDHLTISFLLMIRWYGNIWWQIWRTITQCWCSMNRWHSARLAQWLWPPTHNRSSRVHVPFPARWICTVAEDSEQTGWTSCTMIPWLSMPSWFATMKGEPFENSHQISYCYKLFRNLFGNTMKLFLNC